MTAPEDILPIYERVGPDWAARRDRSLFAAPGLDMLQAGHRAPAILDLGCGGGAPVDTNLWHAARG